MGDQFEKYVQSIFQLRKLIYVKLMHGCMYVCKYVSM